VSGLELGTFGPMGPRSDRFGTYGLGDEIRLETADYPSEWKIGIDARHAPDAPRVRVDYGISEEEMATFREAEREAARKDTRVGLQWRYEFGPAPEDPDALAARRAAQAAEAQRARDAVAAKLRAREQADALARVRAAQAGLRKPSTPRVVTPTRVVAAPPPQLPPARVPDPSIRAVQTQVAPWRTVGIVAGVAAFGVLMLLIARGGRR
jgi:hypothetical protein